MSALPISKRKEGVILYSCHGFACEGKVSTEVWEWVITAIRRPRRSKRQIEYGAVLPVMCTAVAKNSITFKNGCWNHKIINAYADVYKRDWPVDSALGFGLSTTVMQAIKDEIKLTKEWISDLHSDGADVSEIDAEKRVLEALERRLNKIKK
jgi:hypothetical protein